MPWRTGEPAAAAAAGAQQVPQDDSSSMISSLAHPTAAPLWRLLSHQRYKLQPVLTGTQLPGAVLCIKLAAVQWYVTKGWRGHSAAWLSAQCRVPHHICSRMLLFGLLHAMLTWCCCCPALLPLPALPQRVPGQPPGCCVLPQRCGQAVCGGRLRLLGACGARGRQRGTAAAAAAAALRWVLIANSLLVGQNHQRCRLRRTRGGSNDKTPTADVPVLVIPTILAHLLRRA